MKRTFGLTAAVLCGSAVVAGDIDPGLEVVLDAAAEDEVVSALLFLHDQFDAAGFNAAMNLKRTSLATRHQMVVTDLQATALDTQGPLVATLSELQAQGRVQDFQPYWVSNVVRVDATPDELRALAQRPDVFNSYFNYEIETIDPVERGEVEGPRTVLAPEPGVLAVRAPEVWTDLGFDGSGVLVSTLDTGVDGNHPALASRWRGLDSRYTGNPQWAFFDPVTNWTFPRDSGSHGTHTMGSVLGGSPGDEIGVAPGAEWIHAAVIDRVSIPRTVADALLAFQWVIDPDGNPSTSWDVPTSCSNSWGLVTGHGYPPCDQTFWNVIDNCEAAGIVVIFSAGNEGFSGLRRPADRATNDYNAMAVASVNANNPSWPISGFSSRGPTNCTPNGDPAIKPDIAAPGEGVRSSVPGNGYSSYSGTSMASPHVNGVVALMRQANPNIPVDEVKEIIYQTAYDLGSTGEDNSYGWGMIDAYESVLLAMDGGPSMRLGEPTPGFWGRTNFITARLAEPGEFVQFVYAFSDGTANVSGCPDLMLDVNNPKFLGKAMADGNGDATLGFFVPAAADGKTIHFQAGQISQCTKSNRTSFTW